jgi:hypothetical protein
MAEVAVGLFVVLPLVHGRARQGWNRAETAARPYVAATARGGHGRRGRARRIAAVISQAFVPRARFPGCWRSWSSACLATGCGLLSPGCARHSARQPRPRPGDEQSELPQRPPWELEPSQASAHLPPARPYRPRGPYRPVGPYPWDSRGPSAPTGPGTGRCRLRDERRRIEVGLSETVPLPAIGDLTGPLEVYRVPLGSTPIYQQTALAMRWNPEAEPGDRYGHGKRNGPGDLGP